MSVGRTEEFASLTCIARGIPHSASILRSWFPVGNLVLVAQEGWVSWVGLGRVE